MTVSRVERGWAGHFIGADRCRFRRNTLVAKGNTRIVVSTVGAMPNSDDTKLEWIGLNRYYETMAFYAKLVEGLYWDADVMLPVSLVTRTGINDATVNADMIANEMHETAVSEVIRMLEAQA
jgi:hypothetical protein